MSVGLAWKSAAKSNEKLIIQKYATLFLSWMPFSQIIIIIVVHYRVGTLVVWIKRPIFDMSIISIDLKMLSWTAIFCEILCSQIIIQLCIIGLLHTLVVWIKRPIFNMSIICIDLKMLSWTAILWLEFIAYKSKLLDSLGLLSIIFPPATATGQN